MKKRSVFSLILLAFMAAISITSFAYYTKTRGIPNVRITIDTGALEPGDDLSDDAEAYVSVPEGNIYYELDDAEWIDDITELKVGDAPRMRVWLYAIPREVESKNYSTIYLFNGSYSPSNVRVNGGELISADKRDSGYALMVTLRVDPVKGTFSDPISANWSSPIGKATWDVDYNDSGYYDVTCYRGSKVVKRLYDYHGNYYNFYPYMTEPGEYSFRVRTVAQPGVSGGKASGWTESSILTVNADKVSNGSGQTTADEHGGSSATSGTVSSINGQNLGTQYGWITSGNDRYFRYPDGQLATGWLNLNGVYYRFDATGKMLKGWQKNDYGSWFYLDPNTGAMKTGWFNDNGSYYYLRTDKGDYEGVMVTGWADIGGKRYYFNESGMMVTGWRGIDGKYYYFYPQGSATADGSYGYMAVNTTIDGVFAVGADGAWIH